jgi:hypothetical protein
MAYCKEKLKSSDDKASPCFGPLWIENYQANVKIYGICSTHEYVSNLNSVRSVYDYIINHALHVGMR